METIVFSKLYLAGRKLDSFVAEMMDDIRISSN